MENAVIYARVSSERQVNEGGGLQSQEQRCQSFAQSCGYRVLETFFDDGVSGALIDRPGIQRLLAFLKRQGGETVVIIDDISRIARDVIAHMSLRAAIKAAGGRLESPSFAFGDTASDELLETIMAATAQYGRKGNREQVLNRQKARLQMGYWTFPSPPGYRFEKHSVHKKILVPSDAARRVLAPALEGFAAGRLQTNREFVLYLEENGFFADRRPVGITVLEKRAARILDCLPFYAGFIEYAPWAVDRAHGQHEAIVSPATLARLEARLGRRDKPTAAARADSDSRLILRRFVRCSACGRPLTGSVAKGLYPRYSCYNQAGRCSRYGHSIFANRIEPAFEDLLLSLAPRKEFMDLVEREAGAAWQRRRTEWEGERVRLEQEVQKSRADIPSLVRRLGKVSDAVATEIEKEIAALKQEAQAQESTLALYRESPPDFERAFETVSTLFRNPHSYWKNGSDKQKRTVHTIVFTVPPTFDLKSGFSTYELSLPYLISASFNASHSRMVEVAGESWQPNLLSSGWCEQILEWAALMG
jgi:site-specific DNA recombinase